MIALWLGLAFGGEITGQVVKADGSPLGGALVLAYDVRFKYELDYADGDGNYRISDLKDLTRRIRVIAPDGQNAVETYYPEGPSICEAQPFEPVPGEVLDIGVLEVPAGGVVVGRLLGPDGLPLVGAEVISRPSGVSPTSLPRSATTDDDGVFQLNGVPVAADGPLWSFEVEAEGLPDQYLGDAFDAATAEAFGVGIGGETDVGEWTLRPGATLTGTVVGPGGPVASGTVYATTTGRSVSAPVVDGTFSVTGLPPGEAQVWVIAEGLATTWYPSNPEPGPSIPVDDDATVSGVEVQMQPQAVVRGQLVGVEDFGGTRVTLVNEARLVSSSMVVDETGSFEIDQLPAGRWSIELDPEEGLDVVDGALLDDQGNLKVLEVSAGEEVDLGVVDVPRGAVVSGTVYDRETGEPVYGAWVYVVNATTDTSVLAQTGRAGRYRAEGLPAGVYRIRAEYQAYCDSDPNWATRYYPDQRNELLTGSIPLAPGQVSRWDPGLPPDHDQDKMDDVWEDRFGLDRTRDDGAEDLDGDGFSNLDEYLLGTNPAGGVGSAGGCGSGGSAVLVLGLPLAFLRRRRHLVVTPRV